MDKDQPRQEDLVRDERKDKLFTTTLDTFMFAKKIAQHRENNNKISKNLATVLYEAITEIESFLEKAEIDENDDEDNLMVDIMPSVESSVLQVHQYFYCKACNQSIKSSKMAIHEHLYSNKHLKGLRMLSVNMDNECRKSKAQNADVNYPDLVVEDGSTHSLNGIDDRKPKNVVAKKERLNSLPAKMRDIIPKNSLPKKMREFLTKFDLDTFTMELIREGQNVQKSLKHLRVCDILRKKLIGRFPNVKVYAFGSIVTGLGHEKSDLDIFVDTENCFYSKLGKRKMKDAIFQTQRILANYPEQWSDFEPIAKARTPILRVFCNVEKIDCDLSFSNGLSTANTALISYMINLQPMSKKLIHFIKFWATKLNLGTNSYLLTLLVIFYLQQEHVLPPVTLLQTAVQPIYIDTWNTAFATPTLAQLKAPLATDYRRYVIGFFKFYGYHFDFTNYIVCILTGNRVPKHIFDHGKESNLPPVFRPFALYMSTINLDTADEIEDLFANYKPLVIQDPFDLVHNVGKGIQEQKFIKIIHFMRCTYELLTNA